MSTVCGVAIERNCSVALEYDRLLLRGVKKEDKFETYFF